VVINRRAELAAGVVEAAGSAVGRVENLRNGWPAEIAVASQPAQWEEVDLYVSRVGSHARKPYEMRFQNPGGEEQRPIRLRGGRIPVLLGFTEDPSPICVVADAEKRLNSSHRFSVLFPKRLIDQAHVLGWGEYLSGADEHIVAFPPPLLGAYLQVRRVLGATTTLSIQDAIQDSGFVAEENEKAAERAIVAVGRVARDAKFAAEVRAAYEGNCALCGLDWGIVEAAHIYPVTAPSSPDSVWNGICMCGSHHRMFDAHLLYIHPDDYRVRPHPDLQKNLTPAGRQFLAVTNEVLVLPTKATQQPKREMFLKRYDWFEEQYAWA
jgi:hypothetical protein